MFNFSKNYETVHCSICGIVTLLSLLQNVPAYEMFLYTMDPQEKKFLDFPNLLDLEIFLWKRVFWSLCFGTHLGEHLEGILKEGHFPVISGTTQLSVLSTEMVRMCILFSYSYSFVLL